jgi:hypothetical protein
MTNSTDKWPVNAVLVSAVRPTAPILSIVTVPASCNIVTLSWYSSYECLPVTSYNIFEDDKLLINVSNTINAYNVNIDETVKHTFYIVALSGTIESFASNIVTTTVPDIVFTCVGDAEFKYTYSYGIYVLTFTNTNNYDEINSLANFSVNKNVNNINYIVVGGGGGGGGNNSNDNDGGGGGAGGCIRYGVTNITCNTVYPVQVGYGGSGKLCSNENGCPGGVSFYNTFSANGGNGGNSVNNGAIGGVGVNNGSSGGIGGVFSSINSTNGISTTLPFTIPFATYIYYFSGGGSGGSYTGQVANTANGGLGGGGAGGFTEGYNDGQAYYGPNGIYYPAGGPGVGSSDGLISTGGGGAGQNGNGTSVSQIGNGGSGIVVLWFAYP